MFRNTHHDRNKSEASADHLADSYLSDGGLSFSFWSLQAAVVIRGVEAD